MKNNLVWPIGIISSSAILAITTILPWVGYGFLSFNLFSAQQIAWLGIILILIAIATIVVSIFHLVMDKKGLLLAMGITGICAGVVALLVTLIGMGNYFGLAQFGCYLCILSSITLVTFSILALTIKPKKSSKK